MRISAFDLFKPGTRTITDEGFLVARNSKIARVGIQIYRAYEMGLDGDPMRQVRLYRSPQEVFAPDSLASLQGKPVTIDHPPVLVTRDNWADLAKGDATDIKRDGDFIDSTITIRSADAIDSLEKGKAELSVGYTFDLDLTPGVAPDGQAYDGVQKNIRGNHVALVPAARCGSACRVSDSQPPVNKEPKMTTTQKITVDGIPLEVGDTAAAVIQRLVAERDQATAKIAKLATDHAAAITAKDGEITKLKADVMTPAARDAMVSEWVGMLDAARKLQPNVATDGKTCMQVRRDVLTHVTGTDEAAKTLVGAILGGKAAADADEALVRAAFNAVAAGAKGKPANSAADAAANDAAARALVGNPSPTVAAGDAAAGMTGREKMIARQEGRQV